MRHDTIMNIISQEMQLKTGCILMTDFNHPMFGKQQLSAYTMKIQ